MTPSRVTVTRGAAVVALAFLVAFPVLFTNQADQNVMILALVLAVGAVAVNFMAGYAGYYSIGEAVPYGIGGYVVAILAAKTGASPFVWLPVSAVLAVLFSLFISACTFRTRGHAFVILSMVALLLVQFAALQWTSLTNGDAGYPLPQPTWSASLVNWPFHYALVALLVVALLISHRIRRTKLGMGLIAIREDEGKAVTVGIAARRYKTIGFALGAAVLGIVGGLYAYYAAYIDPKDAFSITFSGDLLLAVLLGGRGTLFGPVLGGFALEYMQYYGNLTPAGGNAEFIIVGGLIVIVVLVMPGGIVQGVERVLRVTRHEKATVGERLSSASTGSLEAWSASIGVRDGHAPGVAGPTAPAAVAELLAVDKLSKAFGGVQAVHDCSFTVRSGSVTGLIGPNGSGKTTTFNLISGGLLPDRGTLSFNGKRIERSQPWQRAYAGIGRTFQAPRLFPAMSVLENVVAPMKHSPWRALNTNAVHGREAAEAEQWLAFVGMQAYRQHRASELSYGQKKLVELAQILMLSPRLIMLDEPTGGINPVVTAQLAEVIRTLNSAGVTFLIVEHNMPFIMDVADTVLVMVGGTCMREGSPAEVRADPLVVDAYLGK